MHPEGQKPCTSGQNGILDLIHARELDPGIYHVVHISTEKGIFCPNQENLNRKKTNLSLSRGVTSVTPCDTLPQMCKLESLSAAMENPYLCACQENASVNSKRARYLHFILPTPSTE